MKKMLLALALLLPVFCAEAKLVTVDDDGGGADFTRIQDAIDDVGTTSGDIITVKQGTYNENIRFKGKNLELTSLDPDNPGIVGATIITASADYAVRFDSGEAAGATITGFTITGRGIYCYDSSPTISKNIITHCTNNGVTCENMSHPLILENTITYNSPAAVSGSYGDIIDNIITHNGSAGALRLCTCDVTGNEITNNYTTGNGGAVFQFVGELISNIITDNEAGGDGGAIYSSHGNINGNLILRNKAGGYGGGLADFASNVGNNIIAGNRSRFGSAIANCSGDVYNNTITGNRAVESATLYYCHKYVENNILAFNDAASAGGVFGSGGYSHNCFWENTDGDFSGGAVPGEGDFFADPCFAQAGYWDPNGTIEDANDDFWMDGDYHLLSEYGRWDPGLQMWVYDSNTSPCIDSGYYVWEWRGEYWPHGKRINQGRYGGTAEASMSPSTLGNVADINLDGLVDYRDLMLLAEKWPYWMPLLREDLDRNGVVDLPDYAILAANWQPFPLPEPSPMTWSAEPNAISADSIEMTASDANSSDGSGVEYYFQCISGGGHDRDWDTSPSYTDTGLSGGTEYCYRVKARNRSNLLETDYSEASCAVTPSAPNPNPMTWASPPDANAHDSISMTATTAVSTDGTSVEYYFQCFSTGGHDRDWSQDPNYTDTGLSEMVTYCYKVKARNTGNGLVTGYSAQGCATTPKAPPPTPSQMTWQTPPYAVSHDSVAMVVGEAISGDGKGVEYEFVCTSGGGHDRTWNASRTYTDTGLDMRTSYCYKVRARNRVNGEVNEWSEIRCATTPCNDSTPPYFPDIPPEYPSYWEYKPCECNHGGSPSMDWWAEMTATEAQDDSGYVEYFFQCVENSSKSSGWQAERCYEVPLGRENQGYSFRVKARDACENETNWSPAVVLDRCYPNGTCPPDVCGD